MSLADDLLKQPTVTEQEYKPRTEFDGVNGGYIQTGALDEAPKSHTELLEFFGYNPDEVRIVGEPRVSRWQTYDERWLAAYRFQIASRANTARDISELIDEIKAREPRKPESVTGTGAFVFQASDLQLGKMDGYGLEGTVERYFQSVDRALAEFKHQSTRQSIGAIHLIFAGDCLEGNVSQGGKNLWRTSHTITEQVRVWRRMLLSTIKEFAPHVDEVKVSVVGGNHDDAQRMPVSTRADDNWATEGAIAVSDALEENAAAYGHVKVNVPPIDQGYMTVGVADSIFTVLHGHQFRKGKADEWWKSQSYYHGNPAGSHFLCHGHWHSTSITQDGPRTIICSPTFDGGSSWFRDKTGAEARTGGLVYVTQGAEFSGLTLV